MDHDEPPVKIIGRLAAANDTTSDDEVLTRIASLPSLADETDACWDLNEYWHSVAYPFIAMADVAAKRRLKPAVRLLLERACYGDPGEIMRGLRHSFEAIYKPDWRSLANEYLALARAERMGTRLWAIDSLMVLDDARAVPVFEASVREDPEEIRWRAEIGLKRLLHPEEIAAETEKRRAEQQRARQEFLDRQASEDAKLTNLRCAACGKPMPEYRRTCKHCGARASAI
ncbi:MAG TPA: zinc ribbon domain-containing protein [Solimonas sp.]|nr:zinc ribbon domain-containing protein [Solimonas sp.]